jgi:hypothetical protein
LPDGVLLTFLAAVIDVLDFVVSTFDDPPVAAAGSVAVVAVTGDYGAEGEREGEEGG